MSRQKLARSGRRIHSKRLLVGASCATLASLLPLGRTTAVAATDYWDPTGYATYNSTTPPTAVTEIDSSGTWVYSPSSDTAFLLGFNSTAAGGTFGEPPDTGDTITFGLTTTANSSTPTYAVMISNGGAYIDDGQDSLRVNQNYTFAGNASGDALAFKNLGTANNVTATFTLPIEADTNSTPTWTPGQFATIAVSGGGRIGNVTGPNANPIGGTTPLFTGNFNISGGIYLTGAGASLTDTTTVSRPTFGGGATALFVNQTGGTIIGAVDLGGTSNANASTAVWTMSGSSTLTLFSNSTVVGEGDAVYNSTNGTYSSFTGNSTLNISGSTLVNIAQTGENIAIGGRGNAPLAPATTGIAGGNGTLIIGGNAVVDLTDLVNYSTGIVTPGGNTGVSGFVLADQGTNLIPVTSSLIINGGTITTSATGGITIGVAAGTANDSGGVTATINLSGGTLILGARGIQLNAPAVGTLTPNINLSGGILGADANWTANGNVPATLGGNVTIQTADSSGTTHTITLNGVLSGSGGFTETGGGSLHLNGTSTYTGPTVISAGSLVVGSTSALGSNSAVSLANSASAILNVNTSVSIGSLTGGGALGGNITLGASTLTIGGDNTSPPAYAGIISGGGGSLVKVGTGILTLTGSNGYTGTTYLDGGTINLGSGETPATSGPLGKAAANNAGSIVLNGGYLQYSASNQFDYSGRFSTAASQQYNVDTNGQNVIWATPLISAGGSLTKTGAGILTLTGSSTYSGTTTVNAGTLAVGVANALPMGGNLNIGSGASVVANSLGTAVALQVGSLSVAGKLDLNNNDLIVHNGTLSAVTTLVASGYNNGAWNGATGIVSSTAANDTAHLTALGVIVNDNGSGTPLYGSGGGIASTFGGNTPVDGDILVKYTYYGDANLDGHVDGSDYSLIDNGYLDQLTGWNNGDFNYDGVVDGSDYTLIDNAFNSQGTQIAAELAGPSAVATDQIAGAPGGTSSDFGELSRAVPEPTTLGLLGIGAVGLLGRRNRRRRN